MIEGHCERFWRRFDNKDYAARLTESLAKAPKRNPIVVAAVCLAGESIADNCDEIRRAVLKGIELGGECDIVPAFRLIDIDGIKLRCDNFRYAGFKPMSSNWLARSVGTEP